MELTKAESGNGTGKTIMGRLAEKVKNFFRAFRKLPKKKKIIIIAILFVLILIGGAIGVFAGKEVNAQIVQEAKASKGTISNTVVGTGNLELGASSQIEIPSGITVEEVLVESGDKVEKGDTLATVNKASVLSELSEAQEQITELDVQINEKKNDKASSKVTTEVAGRVKKIYGKKGDSVLETITEKEALMLLSLDGKMAVSINDADGLSAGDSVKVILSDGKSQKTGNVESITDGTAIITVTDNGPKFGEKVTVKKGGSSIGSGKLYIHSQLAVVASGGVIKETQVSENQQVSAGTTLYTLKDVPASTEYQTLLAQRQELAEILSSLAVMSTTNTITASESGTIEEVNISTSSSESSQSSDSSATENAAGISGVSTGTQNSAMEVTTLSAGNVDSESRGSVQIVTQEAAAAKDATSAQTIPSVNVSIIAPVKGATPQSTIQSTQQYTGSISWNLKSGNFGADTTYTARVTLTARSGYQFTQDTAVAVNSSGAVISGVSTNKEGGENTLTFTVTFAKTEAEVSGNESKADSAEKSSAASTQKQAQSKGNKAGTVTGGSATSGSVSVSGASGASAASGTSTSTASEDITTVSAFTFSSSEKMVLPISVDELDILDVEKGQEAQVTFDAIEDKTFTGKITKISGSATVNNGNAKYSVEVTLDADDSMRVGMNGSATVTISSKENIIMVPLNALQETGDKTFVYTQKDEEGNLSGMKEVTTGISDEENVEITSGLSEGDTVYYLRSGALPQSSSDSVMPDMGSFGGGSGSQQPPSGGGQGGGAPSGMPGGGQ